MKAFVGVTDGDWFERLRAMHRRAPLDEVNFWQPSGSSRFRALQPGEPFLFKLHSPRNFVAGGGFFGHYSALPVDLAWETFGELNGVASLPEMWSRIRKYRRPAEGSREDTRPVGCILLQQPFFLEEPDWIPVPSDWSLNLVRGKGYDLGASPGRELWDRVRAAAAWGVAEPSPASVAEPGARFGAPQLVQPRLGQGTFRVAVLDAYERRCAVTGERTLPVVDAAHIRPFTLGGEHSVSNGLALRTDIHRLFDRGYVTVTPALRFEVSRKLREDFENGRVYYDLHGRQVREPSVTSCRPSAEALRFHAENVFVA